MKHWSSKYWRGRPGVRQWLEPCWSRPVSLDTASSGGDAVGSVGVGCGGAWACDFSVCQLTWLEQGKRKAGKIRLITRLTGRVKITSSQSDLSCWATAVKSLCFFYQGKVTDTCFINHILRILGSSPTIRRPEGNSIHLHFPLVALWVEVDGWVLRDLNGALHGRQQTISSFTPQGGAEALGASDEQLDHDTSIFFHTFT